MQSSPYPLILAIVGARSSSKGIPHKNIKPLYGKPLMGWIIESVKQTHSIDRVILSTDSAEYAEIGKQFGAEVPFLRPLELSQDLSTDYEYIRHALEWLEEHENYVPDIVVRLFPTTPLTTPAAIQATIQTLVDDPDADSSVLMTEAAQTPHKMYVPGTDPRYLAPLLPQLPNASTAPVPRQLLPKAYVRGNIIVSHRKTVLQKNTLFGEKIRYHIIPRTEAIDIDSEYDFLIAETLLKQRYENN